MQEIVIDIHKAKIPSKTAHATFKSFGGICKITELWRRVVYIDLVDFCVHNLVLNKRVVCNAFANFLIIFAMSQDKAAAYVQRANALKNAV